MCWKVDTPSVNTEVPASTLVPKTDAPEPESVEYGGTKDTFNKRKGRKQLTIERNAVYNPSNM